MIKIKFPDDSIREYKRGITAIEIARDISEGFSRNVLSANFNKNTIETSTKLYESGSLKFFTWNDSEGKKAFWHSSAHVLAQAILYLYPNYFPIYFLFCLSEHITVSCICHRPLERALLRTLFLTFFQYLLVFLPLLSGL